MFVVTSLICNIPQYLAQNVVNKILDRTVSLLHFSCSVAVSLLMILDEDLDAEAAIDKIRELKGPGAIQSVKVVACLAQRFIITVDLM